MKFRLATATALYFLLTLLFSTLSTTSSREEPKNSKIITSTQSNLLQNHKPNILFLVINQFLTCRDIIVLRQTCTDFQNLLHPNDAHMVTFCIYDICKIMKDTNIIWEDLKYFMKQNYYSAFYEMKMFNIKENEYTVLTSIPEEKYIVVKKNTPQHQQNNLDWFHDLKANTQDNMVRFLSQAIENFGTYTENVVKDMEREFQEFEITPQQIYNLYTFAYCGKEESNYARLSKKKKNNTADLHETIKAVHRERIRIIFEKFTDKEVKILANKNKDDLYAFIKAEHQKRIARKLTQPPAKDSELSQVPDNVYSTRHPILLNSDGVIIALEENDTFTIIAKKETQNAGTLELTVRLHNNKQENEVFTFWTKKANFHKDFQLIKGDQQVEQDNQHFEQDDREFEQRYRDQDTEQDDDQEWEQDDDQEFEQKSFRKKKK